MEKCDNNLIEDMVNDNTILLLPNGEPIEKFKDLKLLISYHPELKGGDSNGSDSTC